jgi:hypothetical protein
MAVPKEFWEEFGVSIDDIIDKEAELKERICRTLAHKLENLSEDYFQRVKGTFKIAGDSFPEVLQALYSHSQDDFTELYALAVFAKEINPDIINDVAAGILDATFVRRIIDGTIDSAVVLFQLLKTNPESLRQIYYENLIQRSSMRKFVCEPEIMNPVSLKDITSKKIGRLLLAFEKKSKVKLRRPTKLWWFENNENSTKIIFRREKNARSQLKLVEKNVFHKTGDEKIFIVSDAGNSLEILSRREPKRTIKIAEFIMYNLTGRKVKYFEVINRFNSDKVDEFISRLTSNQIMNVELLSIKVKNIPLTNAPTIELQCPECLVPSIQDLEQNHNLFIVTQSADILSLKIKFDGRVYILKTRAEGNEIEFTSDNKNLRDVDKQRISDFLVEQLG